MKYLIIGNSAAAVGAVEGIRQIDKSGQITVISSEPHHTYSRPLISYLLLGKTDRQKMRYRPDDFYSVNGCECIFGKNVLSINVKNKTVSLDDGRSICYDKLLIATGSVPFIPETEGQEKVKNSFTFMSLDDADALGKAINAGSRVLIIGAGLIGLKCAEGIAGRVKSITVVDLSDRVLSSILDAEGSEILGRHIESKGISFILGQSVLRYGENEALLSKGGSVPFDVLVTAVGVRPNTSLLSAIEPSYERGIVTDDEMHTVIPDVYAAGDCTQSLDVSSGKNRVLALLPNAYRQGECAGISMAGGKKPFDRAVPMNAIGFFGLHVVTAGSYTGEVFERKAEGSYKKLFYDKGFLKGFIMIGDVNKAGIYTSLIQNGIPLSDIDFELVCEKPSLMAFSRKYRDEKLGGVRQ